MKSIFLTFIAVALTALSFGQVTEGNVNYAIEMKSDDPQMQAQFAMLAGSKMNMYFSPEFSRVEFNMGMIMNMITVTNNKENNAIMLMSGMMGNKAITMTSEDIEKASSPEEMPKVEITETGEKKEILGYACEKYILTMEDGIEVAYWTTNDIVASKNNNRYMYEQVQGFPLEFEANTSGIIMSFTATEFNDSLKGKKTKELFDMAIPEGYEEMSMEDLEKMGM